MRKIKYIARKFPKYVGEFSVSTSPTENWNKFEEEFWISIQKVGILLEESDISFGYSILIGAIEDLEDLRYLEIPMHAEILHEGETTYLFIYDEARRKILVYKWD